MRKLLFASLLLLPLHAQAQNQRPSDTVLSADDRVVVQKSLAKLAESLKGIDPSMEINITSAQGQISQMSGILDPRLLPLTGMALSRNSADPSACALLKRIEPSAACAR